MQNPFDTLERRLDGIENLLQDLRNNQRTETPDPAPKEKLTRKEVCRRYKISLGTVHSLMRSGKLPFSKIGRKTLFNSTDVEEYFESNKVVLP